MSDLPKGIRQVALENQIVLEKAKKKPQATGVITPPWVPIANEIIPIDLRPTTQLARLRNTGDMMNVTTPAQHHEQTAKQVDTSDVAAEEAEQYIKSVRDGWTRCYNKHKKQPSRAMMSPHVLLSLEQHGWIETCFKIKDTNTFIKLDCKLGDEIQFEV